MEKTDAQSALNNNNRILKNGTVAVPLKYLRNFWGSLETPLINCKVELKLKWTSHCVLAGIDNVTGNKNNIIFIIKGTKLYVSVVILSAKDNQKRSKLLSKGFEISKYWNEYKTKSGNKNTTSEYRYFFESNFICANKLFVYFIQIKITFQEDIKAKGIIYQKALLRIITPSLMEKISTTNPLILI